MYVRDIIGEFTKDYKFIGNACINDVIYRPYLIETIRLTNQNDKGKVYGVLIQNLNIETKKYEVVEKQPKDAILELTKNNTNEVHIGLKYKEKGLNKYRELIMDIEATENMPVLNYTVYPMKGEDIRYNYDQLLTYSA